jgi:hypothetical protein
MLAFESYIAERGYSDVHPLVAFSGTVTDPETGEDFTEPSMNVDADGKSIGEAALPDRFGSPDYQILLVAEKYQTGFDQPLLLSEIIERLNDRFGTDFTESERLFLQQLRNDALNKDDIRLTAEANPFDKFSLGVRPQVEKLMIERMAGNDALVTRALNDVDFQEIVFGGLLQAIFDAAIAQKHGSSDLGGEWVRVPGGVGVF